MHGLINEGNPASAVIAILTTISSAHSFAQVIGMIRSGRADK